MITINIITGGPLRGRGHMAIAFPLRKRCMKNAGNLAGEKGRGLFCVSASKSWVYGVGRRWDFQFSNAWSCRAWKCPDVYSFRGNRILFHWSELSPYEITYSGSYSGKKILTRCFRFSDGKLFNAKRWIFRDGSKNLAGRLITGKGIRQQKNYKTKQKTGEKKYGMLKFLYFSVFFNNKKIYVVLAAVIFCSRHHDAIWHFFLKKSLIITWKSWII